MVYQACVVFTGSPIGNLEWLSSLWAIGVGGDRTYCLTYVIWRSFRTFHVDFPVVHVPFVGQFDCNPFWGGFGEFTQLLMKQMVSRLKDNGCDASTHLGYAFDAAHCVGFQIWRGGAGS